MQDLATDDDLKKLVPSVLDGNLEVTEELFRRMHAHLMAFLHLLGTDADHIDDVAQDVCLKVYSNLRKYDPACPFLPWMRTIARNTCRNHLRDERRIDGHHNAFAAYVQTRLLQDTDEVAEATTDTRVDTLSKCVEKLSESHRQLVLLRYAGGFNSEQIAGRICKTPEAVRRMLSRIYDALRTCMEGALEA